MNENVLNLNNFKDKINNTDKIVLIDFYADWCGPCRMLAPNLEEIAQNFKVIKVNVDEHEGLAREYGIMSIPCLVLVKDGIEVKRNVGFLNVEELKEFID